MHVFFKTILRLLLVCALPFYGTVAANTESDIDSAFDRIDLLISEEKFTSARQQLSEIIARQVRDERIEIYQSRLRLFHSLTPKKVSLSAQDAVTANDLFDSLKIAIENGRIQQINQLSETSAGTTALIKALLQNYTDIETRLSAVTVDTETNSFFATLEFIELKTVSGDTAYPSAAWKDQKLRVTKTNTQWQKVHW